MYFILEITIDENGKHSNYKIIDHVNGNKPSLALAKLEEVAMNFVKNVGGEMMAKDTKIVDIISFDQICEPIIDKLLVYRLDVEPYFLHIYQRKTNIIPGRIYGQTTTTEFRNIKIFVIEEYEKMSNVPAGEKMQTRELATVDVENERVKVPKNMTDAPLCDMIKPMNTMLTELKKDDFFEKRKELDRAYESDPENYDEKRKGIMKDYAEKRRSRIVEMRRKREELRKMQEVLQMSHQDNNNN